MAADETTEPPEGGEVPAFECSACRGSGQVISNLGGSPSTLPCPWCEGSGRFIAGHDAQAARRAAASS